MNKKKYLFSATYLYSCEAENEDEAWELFSESVSEIIKVADFNDIEVEEAEAK